MAKSKVNTTAVSLRLLSEDKDHKTGVFKITNFRVDPDNVVFEPGFNLRPEVSFVDDKDPLTTHLDRLKEANENAAPLSPVDEHINRIYLAMKAGAHIPAIDARVEGGKTFCVDGHCRTIAARRVKKEVPEYALEARQFQGNEQERVLHMLGTGSGQQPLTPLEQGTGYLRLKRYGMTEQQIADKLGVTRTTVENGLVLAGAPVEVQDMVKTGVVSSTVARNVVKQGPAAVEALKTAAKKAHASPATTKAGKKSKKKKVTAAALKGTAADKSKNPKKKKAKVAKPVAGEGEIVVTVKKSDAQSAIDFLKSNAPDNNLEINGFIASIELELM